MTDEEIMKALECCGAPYNICAECPMPNNIKDDCRCGEHLANYALNLIKRQQAEIERLESANDEKFSQWNMLAEKTKQHYADLYNEAKDILKSEAVKEFVERLEEKISDDCHIVSDEGEYVGYDCADVRHCIDSLAKEMVGEKE